MQHTIDLLVFTTMHITHRYLLASYRHWISAEYWTV